jgi:alpha-galactosidase
MIDHVKMVLKDIKRVIPDYDPKQGYEIGGFVWFQGFNDLVDRNVYPNRDQPGGYALYSELLVHFIRDVRKDLNAPEMPFVIGVLGVDGLEAKGTTLNFREAMAAPAALPEFKGRVIAVQTAPFWDAKLAAIDKKRGQVKAKRQQLEKQVKDEKLTKAEADKQAKEFEAKLITPEEEAAWKRGASNAGYHYLGCAKTFALMGRAFADALLQVEKP